MANIWFTSDQHFYHKNIIAYARRPFCSLEDMHEQMIARYNDRVKDADRVFMLGDFAFLGAGRMEGLLRQLNGTKILVIGNHDLKPSRMLKAGFAEVHDQLPYRLGAVDVLLCHYPYIPEEPPDDYDLRYKERRPKDEGGWLLHGHVHGSWKQRGRMINVGVDVWDFVPVHQDELAVLIRSPR